MSSSRAAGKSATSAVRHGSIRRPNAFLTILKFLGVAAIVLAVSATSIVAIAAWNLASIAKPSVDLPSSTDGPLPALAAIEGGANILLVGSDSAEGSAEGAFGERSENLNDVTMLMHISQDHQNVTVVSFPRDTYVDIPECDAGGGVYDKINTSLTYGGLACTAATVESLTGLTVQYAALIQFQGVIEMSNAVGGVPVCVAEPIEDEYTGLYLDAGTHELQGDQALAFLRTRHGVGDGSDLTRISSQQVFLSSLVRTVRSAGTLSDPAKIYGLAKAVIGNMQLSTSLNNLDTIASIALALKDVDLAEISFIQYPTVYTDGGVEPNTDSADILFAALAADQPITLSGATGGGATLDPSVTPTETPVETPTDGTADGTTDGTTDGTATETPSTGVTLPDDITGQTASEATCTIGRTLDDQ